MSDIKQAIQELREAWSRFDATVREHGEMTMLGVPVAVMGTKVEYDALHTTLDRLASSVEGGAVEPIGYALWCEADKSIWECVLSDRDDADCRCTELRQTTGFKFEVLPIYTSPTPDLSARIEAAAEEIYDVSSECLQVKTIAAIIKRHLEGGGK